MTTLKVKQKGIEVQRLVLKEDDVLVVAVPPHWTSNSAAREGLKLLYKKVRKSLPHKNTVILVTTEIDLTVIGKNQVKEYVKQADFWELWTDEDFD